ncbi:MAG: plastocyanin/azurin family copper-binding protein [Chloroflexota bacterium]|nr:plastocyanin/azurin family copper-binding protein [Chloroflexota bacterium]
MRRALALCSLMIVAVGCEGQPAITYSSAPPTAVAGSWSFDNDPPGNLPPGVESFSGSWTVRPESDAPSKPNALCQVGNAEFPAAALSSNVYGDVTVTARFKPISGQTDQAAGIIFRVQDKDNYYILRANALEANVNLYKYASGRRSGIKDGSGKVSAGQWQELRLEIVGDRMKGYLDQQLVVEAVDSTYKAGRVGLWTKAESVTCFDDVRVTPKGAAVTSSALPSDAFDPTKPLVQLAEHFYTPALITVKVGTTVTWRNVGQQVHDVNANDGSFHSGNLEPGGTFTYTFTKAGHFKYYCIPHAGDGMTGEVVAEE